jgi:hypothetical protein
MSTVIELLLFNDKMSNILAISWREQATVDKKITISALY